MKFIFVMLNSKILAIYCIILGRKPSITLTSLWSVSPFSKLTRHWTALYWTFREGYWRQYIMNFRITYPKLFWISGENYSDMYPIATKMSCIILGWVVWSKGIIKLRIFLSYPLND